PAAAIGFVRRPGEVAAPLAPVLASTDRFWLVLSDAPGEAERAWGPLSEGRAVDVELRFRGIRARRFGPPPVEIRPARTAPEAAPEPAPAAP
ncbi:MAG TPA: hypothetical protein VD838_19195, partial [Anaeromyxobacteraceae bacterium]|nr:hypothetical protein [Anaeromyxobacteraceae bacterium]